MLFVKRVIVPVANRLRFPNRRCIDKRDNKETCGGLFLHTEDTVMLSHVGFRSKVFIAPCSIEDF